MSKVLVIGCGGVASVAIRKCCQVSEVFTELCIASRTKEKCDAPGRRSGRKNRHQNHHCPGGCGRCAAGDRSDPQLPARSGDEHRPALSGSDHYGRCLACGVNYMDTANYEPEDTEDPAWRKIYEKRCQEKGFSAYFDYSWQWAYREKFEKAGLTALLGCGFDPGVTQAYCAYAKKHEFDTIDTIDILDCNGG